MAETFEDTLLMQNKNILLLLAQEFNTIVSHQDKLRKIRTAILEADDYTEKEARIYLDQILEQENERKEREKEEKLDKKEKEQREFELQKLRLQNSGETSSLSSGSTSEIGSVNRINLKDLVPKFDPKSIDITLFLTIFERQARKENLEENKWVSQLISLVPSEIAQIIVKVPVEKEDDYSHIKKMLLKRFRLSASALKKKFDDHNRKHSDLWVDLVYEMRGYMDNWLQEVQAGDYESLKELMLTEQLKRRIPLEMREKFIDEWDNFKSANDLAEKCDSYESIRANFKKTEHRLSEKRHPENVKYGQSQKSCSDARGKGIEKKRGFE